MKKLPGSLEVKLHEKLSKNNILNILAEHMTMLKETFGIEEFKLYSFLECYRENKKQALYHNDRNIVIGSFKLRSQEQLENTSKFISKEGNSRIVSFDKKLDADKILSTVENIQNHNPFRYWSNNIKVVPSSQVNRIIQDEHHRQQEENDRLYLIEQERKREEKARKAREKEEYERPLKQFITTKIMESGLSEKDFKKMICSSYNYLTDHTTKSKYFNERQDLLEKYYNIRLIRYSIKRPDGKVGKVEIYTDNEELIFEQHKALQPV
ncbi:hypothetical protein U3B84_004397 [Citrobacter freundii]|uniref:hypothetical protein n=1 Tax=Citrobacter freundii TaxID=546 RepID=UPI0007648396|nr:hypothetical protein [Citrobacter freundii]AYL74915.1 hypothetical protein CUC52_05115 [Citrobacter freundii]EGT3576550.1 hypothetical protein [Citrobacter freundii]EMA4455895.1 hypothetical protein [Citrobacter freundii]KWZ93248.1 hypothetical protein HMPREF3212_00330 [Citrobacter freundii]MCR3713949.1 hypothetical protein [Citrobacter freundii]